MYKRQVLSGTYSCLFLINSLRCKRGPLCRKPLGDHIPVWHEKQNATLANLSLIHRVDQASADGDGWQSLEWRHQQLIRAAAALPAHSGAERADAVFSSGAATESERAELQALRATNEKLVQCALLLCVQTPPHLE